VKGAEKDVTPAGRWIHPETPCAECVPLYLMPVNEEAFNVFMMCRNAVLRDERINEGKPYDVDINALSSTVLAMKYREDTLVAAVNLMRYLLNEEKL
jgi:hypothetical protein